MKNSFILLILIFGLNLYGQTDSIEKDILYKKALSNEIGQEDYSKIGKKWVQTMRQIKNYPELPVDQNGQVHYSLLKNFTDLNKEKLFNRTLEWLSINYGLIPSYIYSNLEDGKIIFRNSFNINNINSCNYTSVISIKNGKILMEIISIGYQSFYEGHYSGDTWIPDKTISFSFPQIYPIILKKPEEWNSDLNLLRTTDEHFNNEIENLSDYIMSYDASYSF
jgi:hypothetical protein